MSKQDVNKRKEHEAVRNNVRRGENKMKITKKFKGRSLAFLLTGTILMSGSMPVLANNENNNIINEVSISNYNDLNEKEINLSETEVKKMVEDAITNDPNLNKTEKEEKLGEIAQISEETTLSPESRSAIRWVKPAPGTIRIYFSPSTITFASILGAGAFATHVIASAGIGAVSSFVIKNLVTGIMGTSLYSRKGATLHGWNNYRSWQTRVGNTL